MFFGLFGSPSCSAGAVDEMAGLRLVVVSIGKTLGATPAFAPSREAWTSSVPAHGQLDHHANHLTNWCVDWCMWKKHGALGPVFTSYLAEQAGFEPAVGLTPRTLSRRVT